jgi:ectoine hydroxylase-related dioxygenase (phytanoyl-CoA dioxygenase family)
VLGYVDRWARPVLEACNWLCVEGPEGVRVEGTGCVTALPGAPDQFWHRDGPERGMFNVFVPLVQVNAVNGPTEFQPGTHTYAEEEEVEGGEGGNSVDVSDEEASWVAPHLRPGDLCVFDYRVQHRGQANQSGAARPIAYVTYAVSCEVQSDDHNFPSDAWLLPGSKAELA